MARTLSYAIERGGPRRLTIMRRWFWRNTEVALDGTPLGPPIPNMSALRAGRDFPLPDGRSLHVGFEKKVAAAGVALAINGRPVPGAINDPRMAVRSAARLLFFLAGLNLVIAAMIFSLTEHFHHLALGPGIVGVVLAGLAFAVHRYRSRLALALAIVLEILDGILMVAITSSSGRPPVGALVFRTLIVVVLVRAYQAVEHAHRLDRDEQLDRAFD